MAFVKENLTNTIIKILFNSVIIKGYTLKNDIFCLVKSKVKIY